MHALHFAARTKPHLKFRGKQLSDSKRYSSGYRGQTMKRNLLATSTSGVSFVLAAAVLFGASTPVAKVLLHRTDPVLLAGLLYLGAGGGLALWRWVGFRLANNSTREKSLQSTDLLWLGGVILAGGVCGPVLLMIGLTHTPASSASLLLNLEGVLTALIAWFVFHEHVNARVAIGMIAIITGGLLLSWEGWPALAAPWGALAIIGACGAWAIDNNLTREISARDPLQIAQVKGFAAGVVNVALAALTGAVRPGWDAALMAAMVGFVGYGFSLALFVFALRHLGAARASGYFSLAPFVGAGIALVVLEDPLTPSTVVAAMLMGVGLWLQLTERHEHEHRHEALQHDHGHGHDEHHQHGHTEEFHSHVHSHEAVQHSHPHYPDTHHRHRHVGV